MSSSKLRLDRVTLAYHSLKKLFLIHKQFNDSYVTAIEDTLLYFDDVLNAKDVDLDKAYNENESFLHRLAKEEQYELMSKFIGMGADVNIPANDGSTPAHITVEKGDSEITRKVLLLLIQNGGDFSIQNDNGFSASDLAGYKLSKHIKSLCEEYPQRIDKYQFTQKEIQDTFNLFDRTKNSYISINELRNTLLSLELGFSVSDNLIDSMFKLCDTSGDGQISAEEFFEMVGETINGQQRPRSDSKLAKMFRQRRQSMVSLNNAYNNNNTNADSSANIFVLKQIHIDFIFTPRNMLVAVGADSNENNNNSTSSPLGINKMLSGFGTGKNKAHHKLIDASSIHKICKKCDLNFSKLDRTFQLHFTSTKAQHSYTSFPTFVLGFKAAENKYKKRLKRMFYTFSEENNKLVNGRLLFICIAGILAQFTSQFATLEDLAKMRSEFIFKLLDVENRGTIGLFEIAWLLRSASIFSKSEEDVLNKAQLVLTASGAKGVGDRVKRESFNEVLLRFPNIIFVKAT